MELTLAILVVAGNWHDSSVRIQGRVVGERSNYCGSGVLFYSDDENSLALTCEHVVRGTRNTWVGVKGHGKAYRAKLLAAENEEGVDLALLEVKQPHLPCSPLAERAPKGFQCRQAGYPGATLRQRRRRGRFLGYFFRSRCAGVDFACEPGDSGSPIYNEAGEVVAIVWGGKDGRSYGTSVRRIRRWVKKHAPEGALESNCNPW